MTLFAATIGKLLKASQRQESAERKLFAALKSTGQAAGLSSKQLTLMASSLQSVTTHGDETIIEAEALLLTFTQIHKDTFPKAVEAILNVSDAMGQDLKQSTIQIGKALNDPIVGMTALSRVGIKLSKEQKQQVKDFIALNDVSSAQKVIINELNTQFGDMAITMRETAEGGVKALSNSFGDLMEQLGDKLQPAIQSITAFLKKLSDKQKTAAEKRLETLTRIGAKESTIRMAQVAIIREQIGLLISEGNARIRGTSAFRDYTDVSADAKALLDITNEGLSEQLDNVRALINTKCYHCGWYENI